MVSGSIARCAFSIRLAGTKCTRPSPLSWLGTTVAALAVHIADALDAPLSIGEQISLLIFMVIASKGAAGVTGAGLATLAGGLQSHRPDLVDGVGLIVGIDRFMSEARALTNLVGNGVATIVVAKWCDGLDRAQLQHVLKE